MIQLIHIFFMGVSFALASSLWAQSDSFINPVKAGGSGFDRGSAITTDKLGHSISTGYFQYTAIFGDTTITSAGLKDVFITKTDNQGNIIWAIRAGGTGEDEGTGIVTDAANNIIVTGFFNQSATFGDTVLNSSGSYDVFIAKYDPDGQLLWAKNQGGTGQDRGYAITIDNADNISITGYFSGTSTIGDSIFTSYGNDDIFVAKYNNSGSFLLARQCGSAYFDQGYGITADTEGNIIVTGKFSDTAVFSDTTLTSTRIFNTFVLKYSNNGDFLWVRKAGGKDDFSYGIACDIQNNVYVTGYFQEEAHFNNIILTSEGSGDIFIAKYDPQGLIEWVNQGGANDLDMGYCVATDNENNVSVSGFFIGTATFSDTVISSAGKDIFVAKYNSAGNLLQISRAGNTGAANEGHGITMDNSGVVFVTGSFEGTAYFGDLELISEGNDDIFIAKSGTDNTTGFDDPPIQIDNFDLAQNYPNPFNPLTKIQYKLSHQAYVNISVYNILGKKVAVLVNEVQSAGPHVMDWNAAGYASGVYLYRLEAEGIIITRKTILLK